MADVYTGATTDVSTGQLTNQVLTSYDRVARFALREGVVFDALTKVRPGNVTSPGNPVRFHFWSDLAAATTPLHEVNDVDAVGLSDSTVTVTPDEYGNAIITSLRIRNDDYLVGFEADVANILAFNMVDTIDSLARAAYDAGTNVTYIGQASEAAVTASDTLTANAFRQKWAELRGDSVMPLNGMNYGAIVHPDQVYDVKVETGENAWHQLGDRVQAEFGRATLGTFSGFVVAETPRAKVNADGGASTVDTYTAYFMGQEAVAKAETVPPHIVIGPVTDKLMRNRPIGWHTYAGWGMLRQAAQRRLVGASSIGAN